MDSPDVPDPAARPRDRGPAPVPPSGGVDERQLRFERGLAAILLLSGYVWNRDLVIALVAVGVTAAMVTSWSIRPFGTPFEAFVAPRLSRQHTHVSASAVRLDDLTVASALLLATLLLFMGLGGIARLLALLIAFALIFEAAAGIWVSGPIWQRLRSRR